MVHFITMQGLFITSGLCPLGCSAPELPTVSWFTAPVRQNKHSTEQYISMNVYRIDHINMSNDLTVPTKFFPLHSSHGAFKAGPERDKTFAQN